jgi:hypothetical protein
MTMRQKTTTTAFAIAVFMLTSFMAGCQTMQPRSTPTRVSSKDAVESHEAYVARVQAANAIPDTLQGAAHQTYAAHVRAVNAGETARSEGIPPLYWADKIKELNPLKVYKHRVNIVVVQKVSGIVEEGKYIYIPVSSYLPMSGDDGFVFTPNPKKGNKYHCHEVLDFRRTIEN